MPARSELERAYVAGVLDCDGSMGAYFKGQKKASMKLVVTVGVLDRRLPDWLMERYGGSIGSIDTKAGVETRRLWRWQVQGVKSGEVVRDALPYLVMKREQAELFLKLCSTVTPNGARVSDENKRLRAEWGEELSRLKWS